MLDKKNIAGFAKEILENLFWIAPNKTGKVVKARNFGALESSDWYIVGENPSVVKTFNFLATQERHCDAIFQ